MLRGSREMCGTMHRVIQPSWEERVNELSIRLHSFPSSLHPFLTQSSLMHLCFSVLMLFTYTVSHISLASHVSTWRLHEWTHVILLFLLSCFFLCHPFNNPWNFFLCPLNITKLQQCITSTAAPSLMIIFSATIRTLMLIVLSDVILNGLVQI